MAELRIHSLPVTGANWGIRLGPVRQFLGMPNPPKWVFAACRDPKGQQAQVRLRWDTVGCAGRQEHSVPGQQVGAGSRCPLLKKAAQGSPGSALSAAIINMSSSAGSIASPSSWDLMQVVSYRCSKAALNMLTKRQSVGYREHGILCAALHPGWVQTDMGNSAGHTPPMTVDASVGGMLKMFSSLSEKDTGTFLDREGKVVPW
ncbi:LOW QUALITY PROTEIN: uncharacterized protein RDI95_005125 [Morus bassanus]